MTKKNFTQSIDNFIEKALYDKKTGYYSQKNPFGKKGDFITAPIISPLFSEMISIWLISFWFKIGKPKNLSFVELGPGDGSFCKTLCKVLKNFPEIDRSVKIFLLERSDKLIKIQKKKIKNKKVIWIKNISEIKKGPILFFGNEFFDSIPIKQFQMIESDIYEKFIQFKRDKFKKFIFKKTNKGLIRELNDLDLIRRKGVIEYPKRGLKILSSILEKIKRLNGGILLIDYGYKKHLGLDTVQSLKFHKKNIYYNNIGKADITYLVDFSLLQRFIKKRGLSLSNLVSQSFFLKRLGIINRAENISKKLNFREKADIYYRLDRLLNKNKMGEMFKVIFASSKKIKFNLGFK